MPDGIIDAAKRFREELAAKDAEALKRLIDAYLAIWRRLEAKVDALSLAIGDLEAATPGQVMRMARYHSLMADIGRELRNYQGFTAVEIDRASTAAIAQAIRDSQELVRLSVGSAKIAGGFNSLPVDAIKTALGFLRSDGPLYARLENLAPFTAQRVADRIVEGIGLGYNPTRIASTIRDSLGGGLTDALRMTRTVQLYSYREAARANYIANDDIVEGWYWMAELDGETCASCWAEHGTFHTLDETLDDHHNGRCAPLPAVIGHRSPIEETGEEAFRDLTEAKQQEILGPGKFEAWSEGKFEFGQLSQQRDDEVYGYMRSEASLQELVGE